MSNDHITISKFIQREFAINDQVYCYNFKNKKTYFTNIAKLGVQKDYYDKDVETFLAKVVEKQFSLFYHELLRTQDYNNIIALLRNNEKLIYEFLSYLFIRSQKTLHTINEESIIANTIDKFTHSDIVRKQIYLNFDPTVVINKKNINLLINSTEKDFINNSIGFMVRSVNACPIFYIPLSGQLCLIISDDKLNMNKFIYYIEPEKAEKVDKINKEIMLYEKEYGNGFLFGKNREQIKTYLQELNLDFFE